MFHIFFNLQTDAINIVLYGLRQWMFGCLQMDSRKKLFVLMLMCTLLSKTKQDIFYLGSVLPPSRWSPHCRRGLKRETFHFTKMFGTSCLFGLCWKTPNPQSQLQAVKLDFLRNLPGFSGLTQFSAKFNDGFSWYIILDWYFFNILPCQHLVWILLQSKSRYCKFLSFQ